MEMLLSVAVLSILLAVSLPLYLSFQVQNELAVSAQSTVSAMRRAVALSRASQNDAQWGVHVESGSIVMFKGDSYAVRDTDFDEIFSTADIAVSGVTDVVFEKLTGFPDTTGTLTLTGSTNDTQVITINEKGAIFF